MTERISSTQLNGGNVTPDTQSPLSADDMARLGEMGREELILLIKTICGARWGEVALMTKEERLEAAKLKLWHGGLTEKEIYKALPALNAAMDRDIGKPAQSIAMKVEDDRKKLSIEDLIFLASKMRDPVIIGPEPLVVDN